MIDWPPDDHEEGRLPPLGTMLAELVFADARRRRELLAAILDLTWKIGPNAAAAIPALIDWPLGADRETEDKVCYALSNCAPASVAPLLELLNHRSEQARQRACHALRLVGQGVGDRLIPAADALLARLQDTSDAVRGEAAFALGLLGDQREATVDRLIKVARTGRTSTRASALHAVGNICRKRAEEHPHREAAPFAGAANVILAALDDANADVRKSACYALEHVGLPASQHLQRILSILEADPSGVVRDWAASQLPLLAERTDISSAAPTLARLLGNAPMLPSPSSIQRSIASSICTTLGKIGPGAEAAVPALLEALNDDWIALPAAEALWRIERRAELVLPTLDRQLEGNGENVCDIICLMGPEARPLLPKLLDALARDDYWDLQWAAADAIGHVASADPETLQALKAALAHQSGIVRSAAARALGRIGAPAVPPLLDMLAIEIDEKTQEWVAEALLQIGSPALAAVPALRTRVESGSRGLRIWAAFALATIASDAQAVPILMEVLDDEGLADMWQQACDALGAIGTSAGAARDRLATLATYPIDEIRQAAELALAAIDRPPS
jgi:HEAT repeat protein